MVRLCLNDAIMLTGRGPTASEPPTQLANTQHMTMTHDEQGLDYAISPLRDANVLVDLMPSADARILRVYLTSRCCQTPLQAVRPAEPRQRPFPHPSYRSKRSPRLVLGFVIRFIQWNPGIITSSCATARTRLGPSHEHVSQSLLDSRGRSPEEPGWRDLHDIESRYKVQVKVAIKNTELVSN